MTQIDRTDPRLAKILEEKSKKMIQNPAVVSYFNTLVSPKFQLKVSEFNKISMGRGTFNEDLLWALRDTVEVLTPRWKVLRVGEENEEPKELLAHLRSMADRAGLSTPAIYMGLGMGIRRPDGMSKQHAMDILRKPRGKMLHTYRVPIQEHVDYVRKVLEAYQSSRRRQQNLQASI